jgi:hypothetical protein
VFSLQETIENEKQKHKKYAKELSNTYEEDKKSLTKQINELELLVKSGENEIQKQR